jgi:hypothetical protein
MLLLFLLLLLRSAVVVVFFRTVSVPRLGFVFGLCSFLFLSAFSANQEIHSRALFEAEMAAVRVIPPEGKPEVSQESIDLAIAIYGIKVPNSASWPVLDMNLKDRGLTSRGAYVEKADVSIGPAAFSSWSLLASTLGHELEIHCQQNFLFVYLMDVMMLDGTGSAEREAYIYELRNARRFGLDIIDAEMIAETMEYYYPDSQSEFKILPGVKRWLAKNLLTARRDF